MTNERCSRNAGFTLIELILVMVIIGIMSLFIMPRFFDRGTFQTRAFGDEAEAIMRYAQKVAIAQNRNVFVLFRTDSMALCFDAGCATHVLASVSRRATAACSNDANWMCLAWPADVSAGIVPAIPGFYFNALGKPFNLGNAEPNSTFTQTTMTLTGAGSTRNILISPETGYVR